MAIFIGTDEAGYGPNLGPLVVSATVWRVPDKFLRVDLYELLGETISSKKVDAASNRLAIADSKVLYKPGGGLAGLEEALFAALGVLGRSTDDWRSVWHSLAGDVDSLSSLAWYAGFNTPTPCDAEAVRVSRLAEALSAELNRADVSLLDIRSAAVFPERFNELCQQFDSKGEALSRTTLELVRGVMQTAGDEPIVVSCDKHGGRNKYAALLQDIFRDEFIEVRKEGRAISEYRWGPPQCRVEIRFIAKGESFLPSALASMASKYLRELAMLAFNQFWQKRVPGIRPTAGYPVDARRFKAEIEKARRRLGISNELLWRER